VAKNVEKNMAWLLKTRGTNLSLLHKLKVDVSPSLAAQASPHYFISPNFLI